ncbi:MAG: hypothetical protein EXR62_06260 [Chloroflexi bacterium]|nr:hypothetical protein [Chloroflexota bacterium]
MPELMLTRQFIHDSKGNPVAVILPIDEYLLVKDILEELEPEVSKKLREIELAVQDPLFQLDLEENMKAFEKADTFM